MQQYAGIYLPQNHSTCFGCPSHPSSGVHKTVTEPLVQVVVSEQQPVPEARLHFYVLLMMGAMDT